MNTQTTDVLTMTTQKINLIDGVFTATEAGDILHAMLDKKINFHKLQRLSRTEADMEDTCAYDNGRIMELLDEKEILKDFLNMVRADGSKLEIKSIVQISVKK